MSNFIYIGPRKGRRKARQPSLLEKLHMGCGMMRWRRRRGWRMRRNLGEMKLRYGSKASFFGRSNALVNMKRREQAKRERIRGEALPDTCKTGFHRWNNDGMDPEYCLDCGMSIIAHAFLECP